MEPVENTPGRSRGLGRAKLLQSIESTYGRSQLNPNSNILTNLEDVPSTNRISPAYISQIKPLSKLSKSENKEKSSSHKENTKTEEMLFKQGTKCSTRTTNIRNIAPPVIRTRPENLVSKCGTTGQQINLLANYFRVVKFPKWTIHQYHTEFLPEVQTARVKLNYLSLHKEVLGGFIFNGSNIFTSNYLKGMKNGVVEFIHKDSDGNPLKIKLKHVANVNVSDIQQTQILNMILRRALEGLKLQLVGCNYFDPIAKMCLENLQLEIWPGYLTSIRQHEHNILLCADIAHKVMRLETLYEIYCTCKQESCEYKIMFKEKVIGTVILTDYNNCTYRIDDVDFEQSPKCTFDSKNGKVTYIQYYKQKYNLKIRDENQPLLASRASERNIRAGLSEHIMLVPELCRATGLTDAMRSNFRLMKEMGEYTRLNPQRRLEHLAAFNKRLHASSDSTKVFASWNMKLSDDLIEVPARILPPTTIVFGGQRRYSCDQNADWSKEFHRNTMFVSANVKRWCVIVPRRNTRVVQEFVKICKRAAEMMGMQIVDPIYEEMQDDRNSSYLRAIDVATSKDPQILMVIMWIYNENKYSCIKKKCCIDRPIPSQVCTLKTIAPRGGKPVSLMSVAIKVVIQMNAKLMGVPWAIDIPISGLMTIGFDVCHTQRCKKSFAALVATMDLKKCNNYFSAVMEHMEGQEISSDIALHVQNALGAYRRNCGSLPERILFYRDGVGGGQLDQVFNLEVKTLKKKLNHIYESTGGSTGYRLAFVVVSKRINTRLFNTTNNPIPGTVVDDVITIPEFYDFFLVSQSVRQGSISPTSYNIIHDNMGLSPDRLQILTYKFTHLYYNWAGSLRVPAVCQYAHKLAFLAAQSLGRSPSNSLQNQLYFL